MRKHQINGVTKKRKRKNEIIEKITAKVEEGVPLVDALKEVAEKYKLKLSTVKGRWYRSFEDSKKVHKNRLLSDEEDAALLDVVETFSNCDRDLSTFQLGRLIVSWKKIDPKDDGWKIANSFVLRHMDRLKMSASKSITSARKDWSILDGVEKYIAAVDEENREKRYLPYQQVTFDEFICSVPTGRSAVKRVSSRSKTKSNMERGKSGKAPSICMFPAGNGDVLYELHR